MTRQEAFDTSARHLLATGRPSINERGLCRYSGSGCALAPFAPKDEAELTAWDQAGAIGDIPVNWLPEFIREDWQFFADLQDCHDEPATQAKMGNSKFMPEWRTRMLVLAAAYDLDPAVLQ